MRLIDADELLKAIANSGLILETNECLDVIEVLAVKKIIDNAPTIKPTTVYEFKGCDNCELERLKGKWEITYGDYIRAGLRPIMYACGICGMVGSRTNYCPNCGAQMEVTNHE